MKYLLLIFFLPVVAYAGQLVYEREVAKENAEYNFMLKATCNKMPMKKDKDTCLKETKQRHEDVLKGLRKYHLGK